MGLFSNFFRSSESSSDVAKRRLKVAITSDRAVCSPELMEQMKNDIIQVISKYVDIDTEEVELASEQIRYQGITAGINGQFDRMRSVIK